MATHGYENLFFLYNFNFSNQEIKLHDNQNWLQIKSNLRKLSKRWRRLVIQINVDTLRQINWEDLRDSLTVRSTEEGDIVGYLNLMVDESSGKILEVSDKIRFFEHMAVTTIKLKETGEGLHFALELMDNEDLPDSIRSIVEFSFIEFNKNKIS